MIQPLLPFAEQLFNAKSSDEQLLDLAMEAVKQAGRLIKDSREGAKVVELSRRDIKLDLDRRAERIIVEILEESSFPVLCEESGWIGNPSSRSYWVVDGLDGTVNFHYGLPFAAVSIALVREGLPALGVINDFIHQEIFSGIVGNKATLNGRKIDVSDTVRVDEALLLTALATRGNFNPQTLSNFGQELGRWRKVRMLGSAALSLAYVASGRADACEIEGIMLWDVMAGVALVRAAGGYVSYTLREDSVVDIVATNGKLIKDEVI